MARTLGTRVYCFFPEQIEFAINSKIIEIKNKLGCYQCLQFSKCKFSLYLLN